MHKKEENWLVNSAFRGSYVRVCNILINSICIEKEENWLANSAFKGSYVRVCNILANNVYM